MDFRIFTQYYKYSVMEGLLPELSCPMDELNEHTSLIPTLDTNENFALICYTCNYRLVPGLEYYEGIKRAVEGLENV
jgi:hypothetical protein